MNEFRCVSFIGKTNRTVFTRDGGKTVTIKNVRIPYPDTEHLTQILSAISVPDELELFTEALNKLLDPNWEFDPDQFDWENYSYLIPTAAPQYFDTERYNWPMDSWAVVVYTPQYYDKNKYNHQGDSEEIATHRIEFFDPDV